MARVCSFCGTWYAVSTMRDAARSLRPGRERRLGKGRKSGNAASSFFNSVRLDFGVTEFFYVFDGRDTVKLFERLGKMAHVIKPFHGFTDGNIGVFQQP